MHPDSHKCCDNERTLLCGMSLLDYFAAKPTPGPWTFSPQEGGKNHCNVAQVWDANGNSLACIETTDDPAEATANAALIARAPELQATLTAVRTELATLQATHQRNVELLAHATEKAVELTADNARLRELLRELCKSFECYAALNKTEKDWDEYDHMMNPVWQRANKELGQ